jgi:energy-coupling factor transporter ATP-binding protein EcfA2
MYLYLIFEGGDYFILLGESGAGKSIILETIAGPEKVASDADTRHPEEIDLKIKFSEYKEHIDEINDIIDKYKRLEKVLHCGSYGGRVRSERINGRYRYIIKNRGGRPDIEIDDDLQDLIDMTPNDPQTDFDEKCYLGSMKLVAYDEEGNRHESYV